MLNTWNTPWLEWGTASGFAAHVQTRAALPTDIVVSAHGPVLRGTEIGTRFAARRAHAAQPPAHNPDNRCLTSCSRSCSRRPRPEPTNPDEIEGELMHGRTKATANGQVETTSTALRKRCGPSSPTRRGRRVEPRVPGGEPARRRHGTGPGVRFQGRNTVGRVRWARTNEMVAVEAPREFSWRTVPTRMYPDSTEWTIPIEPVEGGGCASRSVRGAEAQPDHGPADLVGHARAPRPVARVRRTWCAWPRPRRRRLNRRCDGKRTSARAKRWVAPERSGDRDRDRLAVRAMVAAPGTGHSEPARIVP